MNKKSTLNHLMAAAAIAGLVAGVTVTKSSFANDEAKKTDNGCKGKDGCKGECKGHKKGKKHDDKGHGHDES